jgi:peptide/nickel transport system substrate-binding protein
MKSAIRSITGAVLLVTAFTAAAQGGKPGVLRLGYTTGPSSLDPARATSGGDRVFLLQAYDRLVRLTNAAEPQPMLATKWEFTKGGNGLVLTLRQGVKFQDGTPFDAQAVKANIDRYRTMEGSTQRAVLANVSDVQVLDANRVEILCKAGCGGLIQTLGDNPGMMVSPKAFGNADLGTKPVGAGPYGVSEYRPGARVVYTPVAGYYDPANQKLGGIEVTVLPDDSTRLNALRSGQLDMTFIRPYQVDEAKAAKLNIVGNRGSIWYYMGMNMTRGKFTDLRVRQALNHAVDKRRITESLLKGYCTPSDQPFREGMLGYAKGTPKIVYEYDPAKAKKLLAEAGLPNGFEFDALVWNIPLFVQIGEVIQAQLGQVGVKMNLQPAPVPQVMGTYFGKQAVDAFVGGNLGSSDPSATAANLYLPGGFFNPSKFSTPAIQEAHARTVRSPETADRAQAFEALIKGALDQAYHVGLCDVLTPVVYSNAVLHVTPDVPTWTWDFYGIEVKR